jgi:hypothetical protein
MPFISPTPFCVRIGKYQYYNYNSRKIKNLDFDGYRQVFQACMKWS